jgi:protein-S-isoprenylcysteine O-methyltransferase Ste14
LALLIRVAPLALVCLFLAVGVGARSLLQLRRHGSTGIVLFRGGFAGRVRDLALLVLPAVLLVQGLAEWLAPRLLDPIRLPHAGSSWLVLAGVMLVLLTTGLMFAAQLDLGASWRIGIERGSRPGLVVNGAYRVCRNPIFACMLLAMLGFMLVLPTYASLVLLIQTWAGVRWQVTAEERYLRASYGDAYRRYARQTGRFFPGIGLLRES